MHIDHLHRNAIFSTLPLRFCEHEKGIESINNLAAEALQSFVIFRKILSQPGSLIPIEGSIFLSLYGRYNFIKMGKSSLNLEDKRSSYHTPPSQVSILLGNSDKQPPVNAYLQHPLQKASLPP